MSTAASKIFLNLGRGLFQIQVDGNLGDAGDAAIDDFVIQPCSNFCKGSLRKFNISMFNFIVVS